MLRPRDGTTTRVPPAVAAVVVVLLAVAVRLVPWPVVFTPDGVRFLADGDPYYHVLRAQALVHDGRVPWRDPGLNAPFGAEVPWPPLFDAVLAGAAWIAGAGRPDAALVASVSAVVPLLVGVAGILVAWALASRLVGRWAIVVALIMALSPAHIAYSVVGRPDQHVLEAALLAATTLAYLAGSEATSRGRRWATSAALGALLCAAFWTWLGSALHVIVLCALAAAEHVTRAEGAERARRSLRVVALGTATGAALMGATVLVLGPEGALARASLGGISAFPAILLAAAAAWAALLDAAGRRDRGGWAWRSAEVVLAAAAVGGAVLLLSPGARGAVSRGLLAAGRGNSWYASITEFSPVIFAPYVTIREQALGLLTWFGLLPLLAAVGASELHHRWTSEPERRARVVVVVALGVIFTALTAFMSRFMYYAALPLAVFAALGVAGVARAAARLGRRGAIAAAGAAALLAVAPSAVALATDEWRSARFDAIELLLRPFRDGALPSGGTLLAPWDVGHHARYFSGNAVVASPFGTEGGEGAMEANARFFLAEDPGAADAVLAERGVSWILVEDPASEVRHSIALTGKTPAPVTVVGDRVRGFRIHCEESYDALVVARLYYDAGAATPRNPIALGTYRLVNDVAPPGGPPVARLFERVAGVRVRVLGAGPGREVFARADVTTLAGTFPWIARAVADSAGRAELRLPYATGRNGLVRASAYAITSGDAATGFVAPEEWVRRAELAVVELPAARAMR